MNLTMVLALIIITASCSNSSTDLPANILPAPLSIDELASYSVDSKLTFEHALQGGRSFTASVSSYEYGGLKLHTLIAVPRTERPAPGFPIVIANHGYVPEPPTYGITREGVNSRPGDYYRSIPELYTSRGFLVVMPDYRGHNSSTGFEFVDPQNDQSVAYYAEDVVALISAIDQIENADTENIFLWSHSMGGAVAMRAMLATDVVRSSTFWATMNVDDLFQYFDALEGPVMIHHSVDDESTYYHNSGRLAEALQAIGHPRTLHSYNGSDHLFVGKMRELAADRDVAFFRSTMVDR